MMKTTQEVQIKIFEEIGIKCSVKKGTGAHKGYFIFSPMFQGGEYPQFPFEWRKSFINQFIQQGDKFNSASSTQIHIYGIEHEAMKEQFKKERKPKSVDTEKPMKGWGSKNSQLRLDKATARYAKKLKSGKKVARYY